MYRFLHAYSKNLLNGYSFNHQLCTARYICITSVKSQNDNNLDEDDELKANPFYDKYSEKIKKAKETGFYQSGITANSQLKKETEQWKKRIHSAEQNLSAKQKKQSDNRGTKLPKNLNDLIHLELFENKTCEETSQIWTEYFKTKESICAVIPSNIYDIMHERSQENPMFLYPLPKDQGYEFIFSQFDDNHCFFTSLINYQMYESNAPWQLCLTYYTELKASKGIVLMASELDSNALNTMEAQCLAQLQQLFYTGDNEKFVSLLELFNKSPQTFKYMDLVNAVEESNMVIKPEM